MRNRPTKYSHIYTMVDKHGVWLHDNEEDNPNLEVWVFDGQAVTMNHHMKTARFIDEFYNYQANRRFRMNAKA